LNIINDQALSVSDLLLSTDSNYAFPFDCCFFPSIFFFSLHHHSVQPFRHKKKINIGLLSLQFSRKLVEAFFNLLCAKNFVVFLGINGFLKWINRAVDKIESHFG
jgi:hypothetical protein